MVDYIKFDRIQTGDMDGKAGVFIGNNKVSGGGSGKAVQSIGNITGSYNSFDNSFFYLFDDDWVDAPEVSKSVNLKMCKRKAKKVKK
ncbi:hypothetical protein [Aquibacillus salsiterrae]|uniref:Spore germination protein n=1 Tax=Aquibacillus salsiterrae TaxID=2950439 RepID=A0A9X3WHZ7_9BACI|nr:hypothetical protein [Aquibacillus salsiterrae]MDC3417391.1 hypothetical protein [Aquibacillus salsiterrae]